MKEIKLFHDWFYLLVFSEGAVIFGEEIMACVAKKKRIKRIVFIHILTTAK